MRWRKIVNEQIKYLQFEKELSINILDILLKSTISKQCALKKVYKSKLFWYLNKTDTMHPALFAENAQNETSGNNVVRSSRMKNRKREKGVVNKSGFQRENYPACYLHLSQIFTFAGESWGKKREDNRLRRGKEGERKVRGRIFGWGRNEKPCRA